MKKIVIIASPGCLASGYTGLADMFSLAGRAISAARKEPPPFNIMTASPDGQPVTDGSGRLLTADAALADIKSCDAVLIPGFVPDASNTPPQLGKLGSIASWIRQQYVHGALACGSCSGVFMLGEAGLLNGRKCTTTWWLYDELKRRYPRANAIWGNALTEDNRIVTAGGPLSWIDVALHVVRQLEGTEAARIAAEFAVVDTTPLARAVYMPTAHLSRPDSILPGAEFFIRQEASTLLTTRELCRRLAISERTFHRRIKAETGESPKQFIDRIRCEMARLALETSAKTIKQIAADAGYADEGSFRRVFSRMTGMNPALYRRWVKDRTRE